MLYIPVGPPNVVNERVETKRMRLVLDLSCAVLDVFLVLRISIVDRLYTGDRGWTRP